MKTESGGAISVWIEMLVSWLTEWRQEVRNRAVRLLLAAMKSGKEDHYCCALIGEPSPRLRVLEPMPLPPLRIELRDGRRWLVFEFEPR